MTPTDPKEPTPARDAVLTPEEMAAALKVNRRTLDRMDLPTVYLGKKLRRYIYGEVLDALKGRAA